MAQANQRDHDKGKHLSQTPLYRVPDLAAAEPPGPQGPSVTLPIRTVKGEPRGTSGTEARDITKDFFGAALGEFLRH